jgi:hypothetical protein
MKSSRTGLYSRVTNQVNIFAQCLGANHFQVWSTASSSFNADTSLRSTYAGMNHSAVGTNKMIAFNSSGWGYTSGVFLGVYDLSNAAAQPAFSVDLKPLGNAGNNISQSIPPGCYIAGSKFENPDCNLSEVLDSHLSWVGDDGSDTKPACGTSYNYATLGPAFNAWQNMETCYQTNPTYGALPTSSVGNVWQFSHTFATGTSDKFDTQFQISEYSQDGKWLFWSSDWNCQNGSKTGVTPTVWAGTGTHVSMLAVTAVPANPTSLCGLPWAASSSYVTGNLINPVEGTSGSGAIDDVFQALTDGTTGSQSLQPGGQPQCGSASCFKSSTPPTATAAGGTICDSASGASFSPSLPYSSSCPGGVVWQDLGPQTQRGDVFAVKLQ